MKRLLAAGAVLVLTTGCAAAGAGALAGAVLVGAGVLSYECYDYVSITVIDEATGEKTCAAEVTVAKGGSQDVLGSCYYAPLTPGRWAVRATLPGRQAVTSTVDVQDQKGCQPAVSTVLLMIPPPGAAPEPRRVESASLTPSPPARSLR